jgi:hypothetical protein
MIFSSADILQLLGGNSIIRAAASKIVIVDKKPLVSGYEGFHIYIEKYPTEEEFEVTWNVWIESDGSEPDDILLAEMRRILPGFKMRLGLLIEASVTEFKSENTETRPKPATPAPAVMPPAGWIDGLERRVTELIEDVNDRMLLVRPGRPGRDGARGERGPMGPEGRPGKDMVATNATLDDLLDVEIGAKIPVAKGQVLTFDGIQWTNLYVPQLLSSTSGGGGKETTTFTSGQIGSTIVWRYHDEPGEPAHRNFHSDNTNGELITFFHVSKVNEAGNNVELLLETLLPSSGQIYIVSNDDPSQVHLYSIESYTETANGFQINVTHIETPGPEPDLVPNHDYSFYFLMASGNIPEAPQDGGYYVRHMGQWVDLSVALGAYDSRDFDGGDLTAGTSDSIDNAPLDGGYFTP